MKELAGFLLLLQLILKSLLKRRRLVWVATFEHGFWCRSNGMFNHPHGVMNTFYRIAFLFCFASQFSFNALATHNRAGEIVCEQINGCSSNMVRCTIITYTKTSSVPADRDTLTLCWGDGVCERVARVNGFQPDLGVAPQGEPLPNDIKKNLYVATHIYPGPGQYTVSMTDPNRNGGILNVNPPGSENVPFHIQTTFTLYNGSFDGCNNTPLLLNPPIDYACVGQTFIHNPGAHDPDGDKLTYELIVPFQAEDIPVPNYIWPQDVPGNGGCCLTLNPNTGTLKWEAPQVPGEYNVAMIIISWRDGVPIDTTIRDMQILVFQCEENHAPKIETIEEICVVAGDLVEFQVTATDPDAGDQIKLSALGSPFILEYSPAENEEDWRPFGNPSATYQNQPVVKTFRWQTSCEHISDLPYSVVFKAEDDFFLQNVPGSTGLATLKTVQIKVVGPPPSDVQTEPQSDRINISWEKPYSCEQTQNDYFFGFSVWRREGSNNFPPDTCTPGLDGKGYTFMANVLPSATGQRHQWTDTNVESGRTYCYRVLAKFAKRTETGQPYNIVESLPSEEVCVQLRRNVPLITNVSVEQTSPTEGRIRVRWVKPRAEHLDTLLNPPPYRYELRRANGIGGANFTTIAEFTAQSYWQLSQNEYLDVGLNTLNEAYTYDIAFFVNNETTPLGYAPAASSVYLSITPTDNANSLSWNYAVPWVNENFVVYRFNGIGWDSIGNTTSTSYLDEGLINGREYCYYIRSEGTYGIPEIPAPLINYSQEACSSPMDDVPPCPLQLGVHNICNEDINCQTNEVLKNRLSWINPMNLCEKTDDVVRYNIYFAATEGEELQLIGTTNDPSDTTFYHQPDRGIAGCYAVTALDTFFNESNFSNIVCVDNCPNYQLPNAFTPNDDGFNDLYTPYPYCFIESVEMLIFNRWGELVFRTNDPNLNWTGENLNGQPLPAGTYHYVCKVIEQRVTGNVLSPVVLRGYIDLIR